MGVNDLQVNTVPDPPIVNPHDVVLKVRLTTTCGSDLHLIDGYIPTMREGDVIGHEYMGEIADVGPEATKVKVGDRVVVRCFLGCGTCWYCEHELWSLCDNTHPKPELAEPILGYPPAAIPGYSHAFSGLAGSPAQQAVWPPEPSVAGPDYCPARGWRVTGRRPASLSLGRHGRHGRLPRDRGGVLERNLVGRGSTVAGRRRPDRWRLAGSAG
jgi:threonine dehydrogenase-like Zn-dependent dehydrogenase